MDGYKYLVLPGIYFRFFFLNNSATPSKRRVAERRTSQADPIHVHRQNIRCRWRNLSVRLRIRDQDMPSLVVSNSEESRVVDAVKSFDRVFHVKSPSPLFRESLKEKVEGRIECESCVKLAILKRLDWLSVTTLRLYKAKLR